MENNKIRIPDLEFAERVTKIQKIMNEQGYDAPEVVFYTASNPYPGISPVSTRPLEKCAPAMLPNAVPASGETISTVSSNSLLISSLKCRWTY